jgi:hypothetical protein
MVEYNEDLYVPADISGKESVVKAVVEDFVVLAMGSTVEEQRVKLPFIRKAIGDAVSYVVENMPDGVSKVDGYVIEPLLIQVVDEKIGALPSVE